MADLACAVAVVSVVVNVSSDVDPTIVTANVAPTVDISASASAAVVVDATVEVC